MGGHFYPIIAIAQAVNQIRTEHHISNIDMYYFSDTDSDAKSLLLNNLQFVSIVSGKRRTKEQTQNSLSAKIHNLLDLFKLGIGSIQAFFKILFLYPDVVFSKGGYGSFPTLLAARILRIPLIIHESDSVPGRVSVWSGKFAQLIALSFKEALEYFPGQEEKIAHTGQPILRELLSPTKLGSYEFLDLDENIPIIFVVGGSQGAAPINSVLEKILPELLHKYQIIHQVGENNIKEYKKITDSILSEHPHQDRYKQFDILNTLAMKMTGGVSNLVISRSGSGLFEIAAWGTPSILIPYRFAHSDHQRKNAFNYARSGACVVIEEKNCTPNVLLSEINRIMSDKNVYQKMQDGTKEFFIPNAANKIASELIRICLEHEK